MKNLYYINPSSLEEYQNLIGKAEAGLDLSLFVNGRKPATIDEQGIAHVHVTGSLVDEAAPIHALCGGTSYRQLAEELESVTDQGARGVLLHVNSGGGMVSGCVEAAKAITGLQIPAVTYCEGVMCSAAYKLGCGADYIVSRESANIGNIGTILTYYDESKLLDRVGVEIKSITNEGATLKDTFHKMPLTDEQETFLQASITKAGEAFQSHVLSQRPNLDQGVFDARWVTGSEQVETGLADEIGGESVAYKRLLEIIAIG